MHEVICPSCRNPAERKISHSAKNPDTYYYVCPYCPDTKDPNKRGKFIRMGGKVTNEEENPKKRRREEEEEISPGLKEKIDMILAKVEAMHAIMTQPQLSP